jgi:hypothetical protein
MASIGKMRRRDIEGSSWGVSGAWRSRTGHEEIDVAVHDRV